MLSVILGVGLWATWGVIERRSEPPGRRRVAAPRTAIAPPRHLEPEEADLEGIAASEKEAPPGGAMAPDPEPGEPLRVELAEEPARWYAGHLEDTGADALYRGILAELGGGAVRYDPNLSHAAREVVGAFIAQGALPATEITGFLLHSGGVAESHGATHITHTTDAPSAPWRG